MAAIDKHKSKRIVCDKKDSCHRHIAWRDLMKSNKSIMVSMTFPADCINCPKQFGGGGYTTTSELQPNT